MNPDLDTDDPDPEVWEPVHAQVAAWVEQYGEREAD